MAVGANVQSQLATKDELIKQLQDQVVLWRNKYEALAKLYSQLRTEHLDMLSKFKQMQLKANSAQEAIDRMERMERDVKAKNLELADMIRERDRARFDLDRIKSVCIVELIHDRVMVFLNRHCLSSLTKKRLNEYAVNLTSLTNARMMRHATRVLRFSPS